MAVGAYVYGNTKSAAGLQPQLTALIRQTQYLTQRAAEQDRRIERLEKRCTDLTARLATHANTLPEVVTVQLPKKGQRSHPATRVKAHIKELNESGWKMRDIAAAAGVSTAVVVGLHTGKRPNVSPRIETLILALRPLRKRA